MTSSISSISSIATAKNPTLLTSSAAKAEAANIAKAAKAQAAEIAKAVKATAAAEKAAQARTAAAAKAAQVQAAAVAKAAQAQVAAAAKAAAAAAKVAQAQAAAAAKALAAQAVKDAKAGKTAAPKTTPDPGLYNQNGSVAKPMATQASDSNQFVAGEGDVVVDIKNSDSGYNNKIFWSSDNFKTRNYLGIDNQTGTYNIGKFAAGTKIDFGIDNGVGQFFKTGAATNNVDNLEHARFTKTTEGTVIGFEDLYGGGDKDFNDAIIAVKTIPNPIASTNRSGLGDGTNPGQGSGTDNATNLGTYNPNNANAYFTQSAPGSLLKIEA